MNKIVFGIVACVMFFAMIGIIAVKTSPDRYSVATMTQVVEIRDWSEYIPELKVEFHEVLKDSLMTVYEYENLYKKFYGAHMKHFHIRAIKDDSLGEE